jgi:hypothetical protein
MRTAFAINDGATVAELLAQLDAYPVGYLPPLLRGERTLARAKQLAETGAADADGAFAAAVAELRAVGSPYHLAYALLDHADHLVSLGQADQADGLRDEVRAIGERLRAPVLLERANATSATRVG